jgi:cytochrome c oxidase subunit II
MTRTTTVLILLALSVAGCGKSNNSKEPVRIKVVAKKYRFEPQEIRLKKGEEVVLEVSTADVQHGFHVPELDITEPIQKGKVAEIRFTPKERGAYNVECNIICGPGHDDMAGKIIVE